MIKKIICLFASFLILPVAAGQLDDALKNNKKVFLYLTSSSCRYCVMFDSIYEKVSKIYADKCCFLKFDVASKEGVNIAKNLRVNYVPYVVLVEAKNGDGYNVPTKCLLSFSCCEKVVNDFVNR